MKYLLLLAVKSAWNRRFTLCLTVIAVAVSVTLLLGVERLRTQTHENFSHSISKTDLVVGARTHPVQLMLYAVFRIGGATNNMRWDSYQAVVNNPMVDWTIPISLGDSHHGFPVLGTTADYFEHFRYGDAQQLIFVKGKPFNALFDVVLGSEVAAQRGYKLGDAITLSHGMRTDGPEHQNKPFTVVGILAPTATPADRTVHVSLEAINAVHLDWVGGAPVPGFSIPAKHVKKFDLAPKEITAALVGLKNRAAVFKVQRELNNYDKEPLIGVMPGVALEQLWQVVNVADKTLKAVSALVIVVGLSGLIAVVLAGLNERRRELAILRSVGAKPRDVFLLLSSEGLFITLSGIVFGLVLLTALAVFLAPIVQSRYGMALNATAVSVDELKLLAMVLGVGLLASVVPGYRAYKLSLADGLTPKI